MTLKNPQSAILRPTISTSLMNIFIWIYKYIIYINHIDIWLYKLYKTYKYINEKFTQFVRCTKTTYIFIYPCGNITGNWWAQSWAASSRPRTHTRLEARMKPPTENTGNYEKLTTLTGREWFIGKGWAK
jgi:hypothetical protein